MHVIAEVARGRNIKHCCLGAHAAKQKKQKEQIVQKHVWRLQQLEV